MQERLDVDAGAPRLERNTRLLPGLVALGVDAPRQPLPRQATVEQARVYGIELERGMDATEAPLAARIVISLTAALPRHATADAPRPGQAQVERIDGEAIVPPVQAAIETEQRNTPLVHRLRQAIGDTNRPAKQARRIGRRREFGLEAERGARRPVHERSRVDLARLDRKPTQRHRRQALRLDLDPGGQPLALGVDAQMGLEQGVGGAKACDHGTPVDDTIEAALAIERVRCGAFDTQRELQSSLGQAERERAQPMPTAIAVERGLEFGKQRLRGVMPGTGAGIEIGSAAIPGRLAGTLVGLAMRLLCTQRTHDESAQHEAAQLDGQRHGERVRQGGGGRGRSVVRACPGELDVCRRETLDQKAALEQRSRLPFEFEVTYLELQPGGFIAQHVELETAEHTASRTLRMQRAIGEAGAERQRGLKSGLGTEQPGPQSGSAHKRQQQRGSQASQPAAPT